MDEYFDSQPQSLFCGNIAELYRQRVLQDSTRVFKDSQGSIELVSWPKRAQGTLRTVLSAHPAHNDCEQRLIWIRMSIQLRRCYRASRYAMLCQTFSHPR